MKYPKAFAKLLTKAIYRIAAEESKRIRVIHDELGYALGREETAGSAIEYWRKGYIPTKPTDIERLAHELLRRGGFPEHSSLEQFLRYAGHPEWDRVCTTLMQLPVTESYPAVDPVSIAPPPAPSSLRITLTIEGDLTQFTAVQRERLIMAIADETAVSPEHIHILRVVPGSVRVLLELPAAAGQSLTAPDGSIPVTLQQLGVIALEVTDVKQSEQLQQLVIAILHCLLYQQNLTAAQPATEGTAANELRHLVLAGLAQLDDPLLPATGVPDLTDPIQRDALAAYLEVRLEQDVSLQEQLTRLLQAPDLQWTPRQQITALVALVAQQGYRTLDRVPAALVPALRHYFQHLRDPWQAAQPPSWWRWLPLQLRLAAEGRDVDPEARHVQLTHASLLEVLRLDPATRQAALIDPDQQVLREQAVNIARRFGLAKHEQPTFVSAYLAAMTDIRQFVQDDLLPLPGDGDASPA